MNEAHKNNQAENLKRKLGRVKKVRCIKGVLIYINTN